MTTIWVKCGYDYGDDMARDLGAEPDSSVVEGVALASLAAKVAGALLTCASRGLGRSFARRVSGWTVAGRVGPGEEAPLECVFDSSPSCPRCGLSSGTAVEASALPSCGYCV